MASRQGVPPASHDVAVTPTIEVVLFDLGGVLIQLTGVAAMRELASLDSDDEVTRRWLTCEWVRRFERGRCSPEEFARGVVDDWQLDIEPAAFIELFREWPKDLFDGALELVADVRRNYRVGAVSNTNAIHWPDHQTRLGLSSAFDIAFLSHELDLIKPDAAFFEHVLTALDVAPSRVLFLDDSEPNVRGAAAIGMRTAHVRGVDEALAALVAAGIVGSDAE